MRRDEEDLVGAMLELRVSGVNGADREDGYDLKRKIDFTIHRDANKDFGYCNEKCHLRKKFATRFFFLSCSHRVY